MADRKSRCAHVVRPGTRRTRSSGFTLLEVLAAALILALWFTALAGSNFSSLRAEGESLRLLEAGLVADRQLAEAMATTLQGGVPEPGEQESEDGPYRITTRFHDLASLRATAEDIAVRDDAPGPGPNGAPQPDMSALLTSEIPDTLTHLRSVRVTVTWDEGQRERSIERATLVFDAEKALQAYEEAGFAVQDGDLAQEQEPQPDAEEAR